MISFRSRSLAALGGFFLFFNLAMAMADARPATSGATLAATFCSTPGFSTQQLQIPMRAESIAVGDFNNDGHLDIASVSSPDPTFGSQYEIYYGHGNGGFTIQRGRFPVPLVPSGVIAGDFNGDGKLDLAVIGGLGGSLIGPGAVQILMNEGRGRFVASEIIPVGNDPSSITEGDFNGDGHLDLAVTNYFSDSLSILMGDGTGRFTVSTTSLDGTNGYLPGESRPTAVVATDFWNDGRIELAVANSADGSVTFLLYQNGTFVHGLTGPIPVGGSPTSLAVADVNGDGIPDLIVGGTQNDFSVSVLTGIGVDVVTNKYGPFNAPTTAFVGDDIPASIAVGDVNGDGYPDLVVGEIPAKVIGPVQGEVQISLGTGSGQFSPPETFKSGIRPVSVALGEFGRDGAPDIAVANELTSTVVMTNTCSLPAVDLSAKGIEVTQGIQNLSNDVPLIAGKRTIVRAYIAATGPVFQPVGAELFGYNAAGTSLGAPLLPANPGATVSAPPQAQRRSLNDSFFFDLPASWTLPTNSPITLKFVANPDNIPAEPDSANGIDANNRAQTTVSFLGTPSFTVKFFPLNITDSAGNVLDVTDADTAIQNLEEDLTAWFPVDNIQFEVGNQIPMTFNPNQGCVNATVEDCALGSLSLMHRQSGDTFTMWYGIICCQLGSDFGEADNSGTYTAVGLPNEGVVAHELGHLLGRPHSCCASNSLFDPNYPYLNSSGTAAIIGGPVSDPAEFYGLKITPGYPLVIPPETEDVMSAEIPNFGLSGTWPSNWTWTHEQCRLIAGLNTDATLNGVNIPCSVKTSAAGDSVKTSAVGAGRHGSHGMTASADQLALDGTIDAQGGSAVFQVVREVSGVTPPRRIPGSYQIRMFNRFGTQLAHYSFAPALHIYAGSPVLGFNEIVPLVPGTRRVSVFSVSLARNLASITLNADPPGVTVTSPPMGAAFGPQDKVAIRWRGSDPDTSQLKYDVLYSSDRGQTWTPVREDITGSSLTINSSTLPGTQGALAGEFDVIASDGIRTGTGTSGLVTVADKPPSVFIASPTNPATFRHFQTVPLVAVATDPQSGSLPDANLSWSSDLDGFLGTGHEIDPSRLSVGVHHIAVTATGPTGLTTTTSVTINIQEKWNAPPTLSLPGNQTVAFHQSLTFHVSAMDPEATDTLTLSATGLPRGLNFTDNGKGKGTVTGTDLAKTGTYPVTFSVTDGFGPPVPGVLNVVVIRGQTSSPTWPILIAILFIVLEAFALGAVVYLRSNPRMNTT